MSGMLTHPGEPRIASQAVERGQAFFVLATLFSCIVLQRFALPLGELRISLATPLVFAAAAWCLAGRSLALDPRRVVFMLGLLSVALASTAVRLNAPTSMAPVMSIPSLIHWLAVTALAVLAFRQPMDENRFFRMLLAWLQFIAVAGLVQFAAQFAGAGLFSFSGLVPDELLIERQYMTELTLEGSDIRRANGFFLVEPSVFSQFMAIGLIAEWVSFRRSRVLVLLMAGLLASVSGTGWIVLGAFVVQLAFSRGARGIVSVLGIGIVAGISLALVAFAIPEIAEAMFARTAEFSTPGTSGYDRFVTPFKIIPLALDSAPWVPLVGLGPGTAEYLTVPFTYFLITPAKTLLEYGVPGLLLYVALILTNRRTARQRVLTFPLVVLLMITGGYHQFPPVLFIVLLIVTVATLRTSGRPG